MVVYVYDVDPAELAQVEGGILFPIFLKYDFLKVDGLVA
jgi:hypothetical protein